MKKFKVRSLPLREVVADIAEQLGVDFSKNCGIFQVVLPKRIGAGIIMAVEFDGGLGLIQYDCTFDEDVEFDFSVDKVHPVKFLFCRKGRIGHRFIDESIWHEVPQHKNAIVASSAHHGHKIRFFAGEPTVFNSLELDRRRFQSKISCEPKSIAKSWRNMLNDVTAKKTFYHEGFYSFRLAEIFGEWDTFENNDFLKKLQLEGLAYRILVYQITQFQDDIKSESRKTVLRQVELKQMEKAIEIIKTNLEDLPTISDIAGTVGLNSHKLQQGFRELFGKTANEFITEERLEIARFLLINSDRTLLWIASQIGYSNPSYLSKIFFRHHGVTPSEFRKLNQRKIVIPDSLRKRRKSKVLS